jgi:hypothetical protein
MPSLAVSWLTWLALYRQYLFATYSLDDFNEDENDTKAFSDGVILSVAKDLALDLL